MERDRLLRANDRHTARTRSQSPRPHNPHEIVVTSPQGSPRRAEQLWHKTTAGDLVSHELLQTVNADVPVDQAFSRLTGNRISCLPVVKDGKVVATFDYADVNAYLLLMVGHLQVVQDNKELYQGAQAALRGHPPAVLLASQLGVKDALEEVPLRASLESVVEKFANGVHRVAVVNEGGDVVGLISQRRLLDHLWHHLDNFLAIDQDLDKSLEELQVGTYEGMIAEPGDAATQVVFARMHDEAVSSVAVVDSNNCLLGNVSVVDVALVSNSRQSGLLLQPVKHFLTTILDSRGLETGKDPVPVFYVYRSTPLRRVIEKMVATRAHRLWIVDPPLDEVAAGTLVGVVSLTDVHHFIATRGGNEADPVRARRQRRSSSSSVRSESRRRTLSSLSASSTASSRENV